MSASAMTRAQLQQLAKQHGVRANMKNSEIEAALQELGVLGGEEKVKKGLSVRDTNAGQAEETKRAKVAGAKPKLSASRKSVAENEDAENQVATRRSLRRSTRSVTEEEEAENNENGNATANEIDNEDVQHEDEADIMEADENQASSITRRTRCSEGKEEETSSKELPPLPRRTRESTQGDENNADQPNMELRRSSRLSRSSSASANEFKDDASIVETSIKGPEMKLRRSSRLSRSSTSSAEEEIAREVSDTEKPRRSTDLSQLDSTQANELNEEQALEVTDGQDTIEQKANIADTESESNTKPLLDMKISMDDVAGGLPRPSLSRYTSRRRSLERDSVLNDIANEEKATLNDSTMSTEKDMEPELVTEDTPILPADDTTVAESSETSIIIDSTPSVIAAATPMQPEASKATRSLSGSGSLGGGALRVRRSDNKQNELEAAGVKKDDDQTPLVARALRMAMSPEPTPELVKTERDLPDIEELPKRQPRRSNRVEVPELPPTPQGIQKESNNDKPMVVRNKRQIAVLPPVEQENVRTIKMNVEVPDLPPTPMENNDNEIKSKSRVRRFVDVPELPPTPKDQGPTEGNKPTVRARRQITVPIPPPTPVETRNNSSDEANVVKSGVIDINSYRNKVNGAIEALDSVYSALTDQKRLFADLEAVREENKRLRALLLEEE